MSEEMKYRKVTVNGVEYSVPNYICRAGGNGWQIRYGMPTKYFCDAFFGGTLGALGAAERSLKSVWKGPRWALKKPTAVITKTSTVTTGVRIVWQRRVKGKKVRCYVRVDALGSNPLRMFYVGVYGSNIETALVNTVNRAIELRRKYEKTAERYLTPERRYVYRKDLAAGF